MRIALLPLDERPVTAGLPASVAAVAGAVVVLPPDAALPRRRTPGDTAALGGWLAQRCADPATGAVVVSTEALCFGGLVASRTTATTAATALERLDVLRRARTARPGLPVLASTLLLRASDSYDADEEPAYWAEHGRELHRLGALRHGSSLGDDGAAGELAAVAARVPEAVRGDFLRRRLRNHLVNLEAVSLASAGVLDALLLTADDTAARSAGGLEQTWLRTWTRALPGGERVLVHPGADEVGAVLVARALVLEHARGGGGPVRLAVACAQPGGLGRVAPYEDRPVGEGAAGQVAAAGAVVVADGGAGDGGADAVLVVHAPDPDGGDWVQRPPLGAPPGPAAETAELVADLLAAGRRVALADVRFANGSDPALVDALHRRRLLGALSAYAGWNTAGNAVGTAVATAVAVVVGGRSGALDEGAARRLLLHRLVEDHGYQALVRTAAVRSLPQRDGRPHLDPEHRAAWTAQVAGHLGAVLEELDPWGGHRVTGVRLPWDRTFEVDLVVRSAPAGPG